MFLKSHSLILVLTFTALILCIFPYLSSVPAWDGGWYTACLLNASEAEFHLKHFNCVGHTSFAYMLVLSISQYLDFGNIFLLQTTNLLLWIIACCFFYALLRKLFPAENLKTEQALLSSVLAFSPAINSNLLHLNLDFGVLVFFIPTLYFLYTQKILCLAISGTLMVFTKETGAALYVISIFAYFLAFELGKFSKTSFFQTLSKVALMNLPLALYALRIIYRVVRHPELNIFYTEDGYHFEESSPLTMIFDFNFWNPSFKAYLIDIFVLQFNWIISLLGLIGIIFFLARKNVSLKNISTNKQAFFLFILLAGTTYLVTRHRPFNHLRYLLIVQPVLFLFIYSLVQKTFPTPIKKIFFVILLSLYAVSNFRTIDPVSKYLFGTFKFGQHDLLNMSAYFFKPNADHQIFNRDELVYNFEYLKIHQLSEEFFKDIQLNPYLTFMGSQDSRFFWPGLVDAQTLQRTGRRQDVFKPHYFDYVKEFGDVVDKPKILYYLEFPNIPVSTQQQGLNQWYHYKDTKIYSLDGYELPVKIFEKLS